MSNIKQQMQLVFNIIRKMFTPNAILTTRSLAIMTIVQIVLFYWCWITFKPELMSTPASVLLAIFKLSTDGQPMGTNNELLTRIINIFTPFFNSSLITQLYSSSTLTIHAMIQSIVFSLIICYLSVVPWFKPASIVATKGRYAAVAGLQFVFMLWTNDGHSLKILMLEFAISVFFITGMLSIIASKSVPGTDYGSLRYDHARSMGWNPWRVWFEITVLGTLSDMLDLIRQNFAIGWTMLTMVETIIMSEGGVGKMMFLENKYMRMDNVLAIQVSIICTGIIIDTIISYIRLKLCPYIKK